MNKYLNFSLFLMLSLVFIAIACGESFIGQTIANMDDPTTTVNSSTTSVDFGNTTLVFGITASQGLTALLIGLATIIGIIGLNVIGTGLSSFATKVIGGGIIYIGIWLFCKTLTDSLLYYLGSWGTVLYIAISIPYTFGVIQTLFGDNGE